jgi:hypothetical protein
LKNFDSSEPQDIPAFAGYTVRYHAVQAFLRKTGITVEKATPIDGETIIKESDISDSFLSTFIKYLYNSCQKCLTKFYGTYKIYYTSKIQYF